MKKAGLFDEVPSEVWEKDWVAHSEPVGYGEKAVKYLARYVFRVANTNNRLKRL
ncbi:MAG: transposase [Deltaproteobacteria bacterium]|nr:transposase [Deltaproteobacteria bacterium]